MSDELSLHKHSVSDVRVTNRNPLTFWKASGIVFSINFLQFSSPSAIPGPLAFDMKDV